MSTANDLLTGLVKRTFNAVLEQTGSPERALYASSAVQLDGLRELGAPPGIIEILTDDLELLELDIRYTEPVLPSAEDESPSFPRPSMPDLPGLGDIKQWLLDRISDLGDVVGAIAGAVLDAAKAVVDATLPTITEIALSLVGTVEGALSFISDNLAQLDDVAAALASGVRDGVEDAAGELSNRLVGAAGNALSIVFGGSADALRDQFGDSERLEPPMTYKW